MPKSETQLDRIEDMVTGIHTTIHGAPGAEEKSHVVRLAKVEQRQNWIWAAIVGSASAMVAVVANWFSGKN